MNKNFKSLMAVSLLSVGALAGIACADASKTANTEIELTVTSGSLTIGIDDDSNVVSIGEVVASLEDKTVSKSLGKLFRVEDLKGSSSGYYTTISVSDMTGEVENQIYTIGANNISFSASGSIYQSGVVNNDVKLSDDAANHQFTGASDTVTFINRNTGTTAGLLGKYGATPTIKVVVPANTPAATYKGTITYTLYDRAEA